MDGLADIKKRMMEFYPVAIEQIRKNEHELGEIIISYPRGITRLVDAMMKDLRLLVYEVENRSEQQK